MSRFAYEDLYFDTMGTGIKEESVVDAENQSALSDNPAIKSLGPGKAKTYNVISAFVALLVLLVLLQLIR